MQPLRFLLAFALIVWGLEGDAQETSIVPAARAILDAYHAENPRPAERKLHVICWRPRDRPFAEDRDARLQPILEHIQTFYADEMERHGFGRRSIQFDYTTDKALVVHEAVGSADFANYKKPEGARVKDDCWPVLREAGLDPDRETVVIFTNLSDWDPVANTFSHKSPYYARGNQKSGIAWQLESPELDVKNLPLETPIITDGEYGKISLGRHNSIFIGGIAHELGHALGLPHCRQRRDEGDAFGTALMGSGNRTYFQQVRGEGKGTFLTLAHALRLASHPQFSGSVKGMNLPARATFSEMAVEESDSHFKISGTVTSPIPIYAVIAYLDPEGGGDYDARTVSTVPNPAGEFELNCWPLKLDTSSVLRVVALLANGATSTWQSSYRVDASGQVDLTTLRATTELAPFLKIARSDTAEAEALLSNVENAEIRAIGQQILEGLSPDRTTSSLAEWDAEAIEAPLSSITSEEAAVGWQKPAYDHLPNDQLLLLSGSQVFATGIYAHAPAKHVYSLPEDGSWKTLTGHCGLPNQRGGSVVFVILADGKEAFRSKKLEAGENATFEVELGGVKTLELITENAEDGNAGDWGLWLEPMLSR